MKSQKFDVHEEENLEVFPPILFEEVLRRTKFGKFNYILIVLSGVILTTVLLETLGISYVLPVAQCDLNLTTQDKGILSAIGFAGIISSSHLWGFLADTQGRRKIILPTLFMAFLCSFISSFISNFWIFIILRFLNGFFVSGPTATVYAYLGEFHSFKYRSRAIMGSSVVFGLGCISLPLLAWLVLNNEWEYTIPFIGTLFKPWRLFLIVCGLPSLICALVLIKIPESPKFILLEGDQEKAITVLKSIFLMNGGKSEEFNVSSIIEENDSTYTKQLLNKNSKSSFAIFKSMWIQTSPLFKKPHLKNILLVCTLQFGIFATAYGMYMSFPDILNKMVEFIDANPNNQSTICEIISAHNLNLELNLEPICIVKLEISTFQHALILEIIYAVGFGFIGLIINATGNLPILLFIFFISGICGISTVFTAIPMLSMYLYIFMLACGIAANIVSAVTVDLFPTNLRAMAVCLSHCMGRLGSVVAASLVGVFIDYNCSATFLISGISLIGCGILSLFIPNIRGNREENQTPSGTA